MSDYVCIKLLAIFASNFGQAASAICVWIRANVTRSCYGLFDMRICGLICAVSDFPLVSYAVQLCMISKVSSAAT